jgi:serine/threonine protein kinase
MVKKVGAYNLEQKIGKGQFGTVYIGRERSTGTVIAGKSVDRTALNSRLLKQMELEIKAMKQVQNDYVVKLYDVLMTTNNVYLIMEYCGGGDLDNFIKKHGGVSEAIARKWISQMLSAFVTLQANRILHRDLKLANLLLTDSDPDQADIKLADFGFARILSENSMAQTQLGTPLFMAPEIFNRENYSYKVDVWSLGALSYEIMTGKPAFACTTLPELRHLQRQPVNFPAGCTLSADARDIINRMLTYDASQRPSFEDLQQHPFLRQVSLKASIIPEDFNLSDGPAIHEATEEEIEDYVIFGVDEPSAPAKGLELSMLPTQLLDITMKIQEAQGFYESAKTYEQQNELMIAYAFYCKFEQIKAAQASRLVTLTTEHSINMQADPILSDMFEEVQQDLRETRAKIATLQVQLSQKVSVIQSCIYFEREGTFTFDENELLKEAERVLGSLQGGQVSGLKEGYKRAEELLSIAVEANPRNVRASALFTEVKERVRQVTT